MALNKDGKFSVAESRAAKTALREEMRTSFSANIGKGTSLSALSTFSKQLSAQYDAMSSEEREARGLPEKLHDSLEITANFKMPSLLDHI